MQQLGSMRLTFGFAWPSRRGCMSARWCSHHSCQCSTVPAPCAIFRFPLLPDRSCSSARLLARCVFPRA
eukprot:SAG22_NODE_534_length_9397_cov_22.325231_4_plen_69_part_00